MPDVFGIVLAGGEGKRLAPLTADRAKPAVPFGGNYRLIDFALSNLVNAGFRQIVVLTQYKSHSLDRHVSTTWRLSPLLGNYVAPVPAQMRRGPRWFSGSADAIYQNLNLLYDERPDYVAVFGADHIYRMDPRQMVDQHIDERRRGDRRGAARAAGPGRPVRRRRDGRRRPARSPPSARSRPTPSAWPTRPTRSSPRWATTSSRADALIDAVTARRRGREPPSTTWAAASSRRSSSAARRRSTTSRATRCPGASERDRGYWRDVGTLDAFYDAHMDLISVEPEFNLYNREWPILTWPDPLPPAKFVFDDDDGRRGQALDSMVCAGVRHLRRHRAALGALARARTCTPTPRSRTRCSCRASTSAATRSCGARSSTRTCASPPGAQIGVDPVADRERFTDLGGRRRGHPQGRDGGRREGRAAHARVPARRLRRGRRARRVPGARAAQAHRRRRARLGRRPRGRDRPRGVGRARPARRPSSPRCARCRST